MSHDDEHNTDNNFLLLFADVDITPTLLEGLSEVDVFHIALGCRFALDIFTISQQSSPTPDHEPFPLDAEHDTRLMVAIRAMLPGQTLAVRDSHSKLRSVLSELAVTLCLLQTLSALPLTLCPLCLVAVSVHTTLYLGLCHSTRVDAGVGFLWTASTHDGNGKSTHPLSLQDAGTSATRS